MTLIPSQQKVSRIKVPLNLPGPAYSDYSLNANAQTCINWIPTLSGPDGKSRASLFPTGGTVLVRSVGAGPHRGACEHKGKAYFVSGSELIEIDTNENIASVGTLSTTSGKVSMASSGAFGNQMLIVDGTSGYYWNGVVLAAIADVDFPSNPTTVRYMDGRFIVTVSNSGVWYIADLNDGSSWTATQFANAERDPDNLMATEPNNRDLMLFGDYTTEIGTNTGASPFPFEPYSNGLFDKGCAARFSIAKADEFVYWLSQDRRGAIQVASARGIGYKIISSKALEAAISTYTTVSDAEGFTYSERGITFYQLTFPSAGVTWVYNTSISDPQYAWFQKSSGVSGGRHVASSYLYFNKKQYVGAYNSSNLYYLSATTYLDDTSNIVRERTSSVVACDNRARLRHYSLELEFETGTALVSGSGSAPTISVDWSDDGGHTWSNARQISLGGIGMYNQRVLIHHLGMARQRIYRVRTADPIKLVLIEAYADVEEMTS